MSLNIISEPLFRLSKPIAANLCLLANYILNDHQQNDLLVNLKLISSEEMIALNKSFRKKATDTNVLSFPAAPEAVTHAK